MSNFEFKIIGDGYWVEPIIVKIMSQLARFYEFTSFKA